MYNNAWIAAHIPHQGKMCLIYQVLSWDEERIVCIATSHTGADNPLRAHGRLGVSAGIEYAAQAMAVHGAVLAGAATDSDASTRPKAGFLASIRGATFHVERLDDLTEDLSIEAVRIHSEANSILYQFSVRTKTTQQLLLDGRATVILNAELVMNNSTIGVKTT